jgi:hypothetical protein
MSGPGIDARLAGEELEDVAREHALAASRTISGVIRTEAMAIGWNECEIRR